jgi:hypothetical protein
VTGIGNPTIRGNFFLGSFTFPNTNQISPRIATANAGQSSLTLLSAGDAAKLNPANTITLSNGIVYTPSANLIVTAFDMQQEFGSPANPYFFEYSTNTGVVGTTVSLASALRYSYSAALPLYWGGDAFSIDEGGPATIYVLDKSWDCNIEYINITFDRGPTEQIYANGRTIKFTNCACLQTFGIVPSVNETFTYDGGDYSACGVEVDKMIDTLIAKNGTTISSLIFQSASVNRLIGLNSTGFLNGTPKDTSLVGWTGPIQLGATGYGRTNGAVSVGGSHSSVGAVGTTDQNVLVSAVRHTGASGAYTISNGVISVPTSCSPVRWAIPGTRMVLQGQSEAEGTFTVTGQPTDNGTNTRVPTSIEGASWPSVPLQGGTRLDLMAHPCPLLTMVDCTGSNDAINLSQAGARGKPIYSYSKWTYTGNTFVSPYAPHLWGKVGQINIIVTKLYTGTLYSSLVVNAFSQFGTGATVNLMAPATTGTRTITQGGTSGAQSGDSIAAAGTSWFFSGQASPFLGTGAGGTTAADISGESSAVWPIVTIEVTTDQGFGLAGRAFTCNFQ